MKSFKKVLCLVLVVVMAFGVTAVAFAGNLDNFDDAADAKAPYAEAVDVLVGLKVVNGVTTTELELDGNYTREQAAKVIAYLILGQRSADALSADAAPFLDVEADRWSAGYIAFCVKQGIIAGYDNEYFGPADGLTGYQFAKMLLTAVGYGKNDEYIGEGWSINVARDALSLDIFEDDLTAATNAVIARQQAMLMAFNTLINVPTVSYNANFEAYYTGSSFMNGVKKVTAYNPTDDDEGYAETLGWKVFSLESTGSDPDNFGRMAHSWKVGKSSVSESYADVADYSYTGKVNQKDIYGDVGRSVARDYAVTFIVDGEIRDAGDYANDRIANDSTKVSGQSATVEVYLNDDDDKEMTVVVINNYFAEVTDYDEDNEEATFSVYIDDEDADDIVFETTDFDEDDFAYVNIYMGDDDEWAIDSAYDVEKLSVAEVTYIASGYLKLDGTSYNKADKLLGETTDFSVGSEYDVYLDNFGNIIGVVPYTEAAANLNYLLVNESKKRDAGIDGDAYVKIAASFADGTSKTVDLNVRDASSKSKAYISDPADGSKLLVSALTVNTDDFNTFYSYTVNSDGLYTLRALTDAAGISDTINYAKGSVSITFDDEVLRATNSTDMILVDEGVTYTGYSKFPSDLDLADGAQILYITDKNDRLTAIYIFGDSSTKTAPVFGWFDSLIGTDGETWDYKVYVDGKEATYTTDEELSDAYDKGVIVTVKEDSKGIAEFSVFSGDADYGLLSENEVTIAASGFFVANGTTFQIDSDTVIVDATGTPKAVSSLKAEQDVIVIYDAESVATNEYVALVVFIV